MDEIEMKLEIPLKPLHDEKPEHKRPMLSGHIFDAVTDEPIFGWVELSYGNPKVEVPEKKRIEKLPEREPKPEEKEREEKEREEKEERERMRDVRERLEEPPLRIELIRHDAGGRIGGSRRQSREPPAQPCRSPARPPRPFPPRRSANGPARRIER